jgi:uncharacterized protein DUF3606
VETNLALSFTVTDQPMTLTTSSSPKLDRNRVDVSTPALARHWRKRFGKSKEEIDAAIAKVGYNAETVEKELQVNG